MKTAIEPLRLLTSRLATILAVSVLTLAMACGACKSGSAASAPASGPAAKAAAAPVKSEAVRRAVTNKEWDQQAICPVTGQSFRIDLRTLALSYRGESFYFRDEPAMEAFMARPEEYLLDLPQPSPRLGKSRD